VGDLDIAQRVVGGLPLAQQQPGMPPWVTSR
jgi:hypothetical protein